MRLAFDRGTLLLRDVPHAIRADSLPGAVYDARVGGLRAPGFRYRELHEVLVAAGVPVLDEVSSALAPLARFAPVELRAYQEDAVLAWERGGRRGVISLPTGSGKTLVAIGAMSRLRSRTLCLAPTRPLVEQWATALTTWYAGPIGRFADGERTLAAVTVATFEGAFRNMERIGGIFDLLIVDEAHHVGGLARPEMLEMSVAPYRLGLTATPPLGCDERALLESLVGPVVFERRLEELVGKELAPFDLVTLPLELTREERRVYQEERDRFEPVFSALRRDGAGDTWADLVRAAALTIEGRVALDAWRRARRSLGLARAKLATVGDLLARHRNTRTLVFTPDNAAAYAIARAHLVMPITSDVRRREREEALQRFRSGELKALVSTRVLNEGLDVADADVAILVGGGSGERAYAQRIGRLLRPRPDKRATVYELVLRGTPEMSELGRRREGLAARALGPP